MSRTRKIQRARTAHAPAKIWRVAYLRALTPLRRADGRLTAEDHARARFVAVLALGGDGVNEESHTAGATADALRTCGVRYGNQRTMRARMDVCARRADRKRDPDPALDAEGDLGLASRPASPVRRRGMPWTR